MSFTFTANMYKTGINWCVDVPLRITKKMQAVKGYIPVKGILKEFAFTQTLVPVKDHLYRLFINNVMLKGSGTVAGDKVTLTIEQDHFPKEEVFPPLLKKALIKNKLADQFATLTASRKKEVLRYLNNLKTKESLTRNIDKVIAQLKDTGTENRGFLRALHRQKKS